MALVVIILAAGQGKRMCSDKPKVLHECNGVPMLVRVVRAVYCLGPKKIVVVVGRHKEQIHQTLAEWTNDMETIVYADQPIPMGTGNAVQCCCHYFTPKDRVLIVNGDMPLLQPPLLKKFVSSTAHTDGAVLTSIMENPHGYGRIIRNGGILTDIVEEKDCTHEQRQRKEVNTGVYLFTGKVLHGCLGKMTTNNQQQEYYLTDTVRLARGYNIIASMIDKEDSFQVRGANTPEELDELTVIDKTFSSTGVSSSAQIFDKHTKQATS